MNGERTDDRESPEPRGKWYVPATFLIIGLLYMQLTHQPESVGMPTQITADMVFFAVMSIQGNLLIVVLLCLTFMGFEAKSRTSELNMDRFSDADVVHGALLGAVCFLVVLGMAYLTERVADYFGMPLVGEDPWSVMISRSTFAGKVMIALGTLFIAPIVEEIVFRHTLYRAARIALPHWLAAGASAALFAIVHDNLAGIPAFFVLALMLQEAYRKTDRLYVPITMHATFNAFMLTFSQWIG